MDVEDLDVFVVIEMIKIFKMVFDVVKEEIFLDVEEMESVLLSIIILDVVVIVAMK